MATIVFQGYALDDAGAAIVGATVHIYARNTVTPALEDAAVTTDANGLWTATQTLVNDGTDLYDIEIVSGSSKRRRKYDDKIQLNTVEVASLYLRNPANTYRYNLAPAAIIADRQLTLPLLTATETVAVLGAGGLAQAFANVQSIGFPATQVPSADANTLDDYEEGAWTPAIGGTATYTTQTGRYTKIGRKVFVSCSFTINLLNSGSTSVLSGLPFTSAAIAQELAVGYFASLAVNVIHIGGYIPANSTSVSFASMAASGATATAGTAIFGNSTAIEFSGTYEVA